MKSHDTRFDGRFFVGVSSTGIYCRPICRVRLPQQKNCTFHPSAAAGGGGLPPVPQMSAGTRARLCGHRGKCQAGARAARMIEDGVANDVDLAQVAQRIGVTDRHLRHLCRRVRRVASAVRADAPFAAGEALADRYGRCRSFDVAFASGFSSVRRMNTLFAERYGFSPTRLRKEGRNDDGAVTDALTFVLPYRPPYDWPRLLAFLAIRAIQAMGSTDGDAYRRIVRVDASSVSVTDGSPMTGWLEVSHLPRRDALQLRFARSAGDGGPADPVAHKAGV